VLLRRQKRAVERPPLTKIGDAEIARILRRWSSRACCARKPTPRRRANSLPWSTWTWGQNSLSWEIVVIQASRAIATAAGVSLLSSARGSRC
jgi:hypothetical protein